MSRRKRKDEPVEWNFFSFPVAFAFAIGIQLGMWLSFSFLSTPAFITSLFFTAFGVAHIISRWFRRRTLDRQRMSDEAAERERRATAARAVTQRAEVESAPARRRRRRPRRPFDRRDG